MRQIDFKDHVVKADRNRHLMARIALNALGYADRYPVDLADFRHLSEVNRAMVNAFLDWAWTIDPRKPAEPRTVCELRAIVEQRPTATASTSTAA